MSNREVSGTLKPVGWDSARGRADGMSEKKVRRLLLTAFSLSGAAALLYEVVWTRALSLILGSTVYALSTMLATFMAGLAIGAYFGGKLADRDKNLLFYFGLFELGIGFFGLITVPIIYNIPPVYFILYKTFHVTPGFFFVMQFAVSAAVMLVPTTLMGATFPIVSKRLTRNMSEMGQKVGAAYSFNTLGAIFGSLSAGFILIPTIGVKWSSFVAGCLNILVGSIVVLASGKPCSRKVVAPFVILPLIAAFALTDVSNDHPFVNFYMADRFDNIADMEDVEKLHVKLHEKDYREGTLRAYSYNNYLLIQHGGKMEGTGPGDVVNTMLLAMLPVESFSGSPRDMLVIGLGAGITALTGGALVEKVSVVEIHPGVIEIVKRFGLPGMLDDMKLYKDDARRHLLTSRRTYDIITSEPSVPTEQMSANLFTREFYSLAATRLNKGGIFCQGVQGWKLTKKDLNVCVKTFASVFEHVYVWKSPGYGNYTFIGSQEPINIPHSEVLAKLAERKIIPEVHFNDYSLQLAMTPEKAREIACMDDIPMHTDDKPYLEFAMAKNFILGRDFGRLRFLMED